MKRSIVLLVVLLFVSSLHAAVNVGDTPTLQFKSVQGDQINLAALRGKIVIVDFWATWCGPCMAEAPHMVQINQKYKDKGLQMIGISLDQNGYDALNGAKRTAWIGRRRATRACGTRDMPKPGASIPFPERSSSARTAPCRGRAIPRRLTCRWRMLSRIIPRNWSMRRYSPKPMPRSIRLNRQSKRVRRKSAQASGPGEVRCTAGQRSRRPRP